MRVCSNTTRAARNRNVIHGHFFASRNRHCPARTFFLFSSRFSTFRALSSGIDRRVTSFASTFIDVDRSRSFARARRTSRERRVVARGADEARERRARKLETKARAMSALDGVRRVHEEKFFKAEQERAVEAYVKRLKAEGRYESAMKAASARVGVERASSALPQIMAHDLRLSAHREVKHETRIIDREFMNRHTLTKNLRYTDGFLMGGRVSLGKSKWTAGTTGSGVEGTTIFSVSKAPELMASQTKHVSNSLESRVAKHMVDTTFVEIAGKRLKLLPDPTPGRAMAWGGTLAIWGTLGLTLTACKALEIHNVGDVSMVMKRNLEPYADALKDRLSPLKAHFTVDPESNAPKFRDSDFAHGIRRVFA